MGQIGSDITFDELKKMYLDSLELLDKKTTEIALLQEENAGWKAHRDAILSEHGCSWDECGRLRQIRDEAETRAEKAEAENAALVEKVERLVGELETAMETLTVIYSEFPDVRYVITKAAEKAGKS